MEIEKEDTDELQQKYQVSCPMAGKYWETAPVFYNSNELNFDTHLSSQNLFIEVPLSYIRVVKKCKSLSLNIYTCNLPLLYDLGVKKNMGGHHSVP